MATARTIQQLIRELEQRTGQLQAGELSHDDLREFKKTTAELYERLAIIEYQVQEKVLKNPLAALLASDIEKIKPKKITQNEPVFRFSTQDVSEKKMGEPEEETALPESKNLKEEKTVGQLKIQIPVQETETAPLVEKLRKSKITDLKTAIPLHLKFLFMNSLFEGENTSYNNAIERLNSLAGIDEARHFLRELSDSLEWDYNDETVISFTEYVERRHM